LSTGTPPTLARRSRAAVSTADRTPVPVREGGQVAKGVYRVPVGIAVNRVEAAVQRDVNLRQARAALVLSW